MFHDLKPTVYYTGRGNSCVVSIQDKAPWGLTKLNSLSDIAGTGGCYDAAVEDFIVQFDEYLSELKKFRDEVLDTSRVYETVRVDFAGRPVKKEDKDNA